MPCADAFPAGLEHRVGIYGPEDLCQRGDQSGPPRLVAGAEAGAVVAVEVLMERNVVTPVRILLELFRAAEHRTLTGVIAQENAL